MGNVLLNPFFQFEPKVCELSFKVFLIHHSVMLRSSLIRYGCSRAVRSFSAKPQEVKQRNEGTIVFITSEQQSTFSFPIRRMSRTP